MAEQKINLKVTYQITFRTPDAPDVVAVPEELWKYYQISEEDLFATCMGLHYMGENKDLYVFGHDASSAEAGVVEAPTFYLGQWDDGPEDEQVYGPIEWNLLQGVIRRA